jgi:hypothetical protein
MVGEVMGGESLVFSTGLVGQLPLFANPAYSVHI